VNGLHINAVHKFTVTHCKFFVRKFTILPDRLTREIHYARCSCCPALLTSCVVSILEDLDRLALLVEDHRPHLAVAEVFGEGLGELGGAVFGHSAEGLVQEGAMGDDAQILLGPAAMITVSDQRIAEGEDDAARCGFSARKPERC
jgi:hypothetical protein